MIKIHGRATSVNVQALMWAVGELGLEHSRLDVGGAFGGNNDPEFLKLNPNGLVPVLEDGDHVMFEANAIIRYLAAQYGKAGCLAAGSIKEQAIGDMWMEWAKTTVYPVIISGLFINLVRVKRADRNESAMAELQRQATKIMTTADGQLSKHTWLAGENFSIADIGFGSLLYRYFTLDFERAVLPTLEKYYDRLQSRSAYREHVMIDYSSMKVE